MNQPPLYPLTFHPIFQQRVWGGTSLARLYQKPIPQDHPIGESWEICDRPVDQAVSVVGHGPLAGQTLRHLMEERGEELLGRPVPPGQLFPLLIKILDAQQTLSVQVHPPASIAVQLHGEPKTEMWYVAEARPDAELYVGLRRGTTRAEFEERLQNGTVADCLHRVPVRAGDAMFLPSGRVHAIGAGLVVFEVQQNSDTTYRVFDWNRPGLGGQPRALHVSQSLASIRFDDYEPGLITAKYSRNPAIKTRCLASDPLFQVDAWQVKRGQRFYLSSVVVQILGLLQGRLRVSYLNQEIQLTAGQFLLLPACLERVTLLAETRIEFLLIQLGSSPN